MPELDTATQASAIGTRNSQFASRTGGDSAWVADGGQANIWKRVEGVDAVFGVDLKLGSSVPPAIRVVAAGPNTQAATNEARNKAIRVRDKLAGGG